MTLFNLWRGYRGAVRLGKRLIERLCQCHGKDETGRCEVLFSKVLTSHRGASGGDVGLENKVSKADAEDLLCRRFA